MSQYKRKKGIKMKLQNSPKVNLGIVGVSRDCFPLELSKKRLNVLVQTLEQNNINITPAETIIESENDTLKVLDELAEKRINAVVVYLGNFGPEGPTSIFIQRFIQQTNGPVMVCAAAEEDNLISGRGDAYCGMLNLSYNLNLRKLKVHIPENPVGLPEPLSKEIAHFVDIAKVCIGINGLKVFAFGPRPHDFFACNAPIQPLYDLGVEVMENSELDLRQLYEAESDNPDIPNIISDMGSELGDGNAYPELLPKLAQLELTLMKFMNENLGSKQYAVFANKCWPAFESSFGCVPCYVNSRMASKGIPVACEVDIYGAVSEYMMQLASGHPATILDINNTVPPKMTENQDRLEGLDATDLFMGFHCGNTPKCCLSDGCGMKYQLIMHSLMEPDKEPDITRGTLEGQLRPGETTIFRLQSTPDCEIRSYAADGRILDIPPESFGAIGIIGIKNMARFYRHVIVGKHFPHHTAVGFNHSGAILFDAVKIIAGKPPMTPLSPADKYHEENPF